LKAIDRKIQIIVFTTSLTILAYEIVLTRITALVQWQNLTSIVISIAMLGFGVSGTAVMLLEKPIEKKIEKHMGILLFLYPVSIIVCFIIYCKIPFNPFEIGIDTIQIYYLGLKLMAVGIPFFFGAMIIGISLMIFPVSLVYFSNLIGSGSGALLVVVLLYFLHPFTVLVIITAIALFSGVYLAAGFSRQLSCSVLTVSVILVIAFYGSIDSMNLKKMSQYKAVSGALNLPDAAILKERYSPLSVVQVVKADGLRSTPGLSFKSPYPVPVQKGIFFDGEGMSAISPYDGELNSIRHLDYTPSALPYHLLARGDKDKVLIVGVGGGQGILKANLYGFNHIYGLELDKNVISLMKTDFAEFSGNIYNQPNLVLINKEARGYVGTTTEKFDLVDLSMVDAFNTAASGVHAFNETYLYTVESLQTVYSVLKNNGLLAISRWIVTPARDNLKMINIAITALKRSGISNLKNHLIFIRSVQTATLIISKQAFSTEAIQKTKQFCQQRLFDMIYYPGIHPEEAGRFIRMPEPDYYYAVQELISDHHENFEKDYPYDITPATDNKPYFYHFFKWGLIGKIMATGTEEVPFTEWGFLILIMMLVTACIVSLLFIVMPLALLKDISPVNFRIGCYFAFIATGFFFVEIPLIQKLILFLAHPSYSISVIISSLLVSSGIGSYFSDKVFAMKKGILYSTISIIVVILSYQLTLDSILSVFTARSEIIKTAVTLVLIMPLGFFMGLPFPKGLTMVKKIDRKKVPWAFGINSFFSVISILLAALLAIISGFRTVFLLASVVYLAAGLVSLGIYSKTD